MASAVVITRIGDTPPAVSRPPRSALKRFQKALNRALNTILRWGSATMRLHDHGENVRTLQRLLINRLKPEDRFNLQTTGKYDQNTASAVRQFQTKIGLKISGVADDMNLEMLLGHTVTTAVSNSKSIDEQTANKYVCWAYSLVYFLKSTNHKGFGKGWSPDQWVTHMREKKRTGKNDGLIDTGWSTLAKECHLTGHWFIASTAQRLSNMPSELRAEALFKQINKVGYMILGYKYDNYISHVVVIDGMQLDGKEARHLISVQDPWVGGRASHTLGWLMDLPGLWFVTKAAGTFTPSMSDYMPFPSALPSEKAFEPPDFEPETGPSSGSVPR